MNNILILPTALRPGANSTRVAGALELRLTEVGASATLLDFSTVPLFGSVERDAPARVAAYRDALSGAEAIVWVVPTYHNDMPGSAKNALDHLEPGFLTAQINAVVGVANSDSFPGATKFSACLRFIGGRVPLGDLFIGDIRNTWPKDEGDPPEALADRLSAFARRLVKAVDAAKA